MKECVYAKCSFNYIKRRHRAYLWMFRMRMSVDINDKTGTVTILHYKWAFGHQFVMGEEVRKFEDEELDNGRLKLTTPKISQFILWGKTRLARRIFPKIDLKNLKPHDGAQKEFFNNQQKEETMKSNIGIARVCHEANRQYCIDNEKTPQLKWDELPKEIQESIIAGVAEVIADPKVTPAEMHQKWVDFKEEQGWKFGKLNVENKTHPNLVSFNKLSKVEQAKDKLFIKTVKAEMKK